MPSDVAFMAYYPHKQRQSNNSFDGNYNIGARVIMDILERRGIQCDICTPDTAQRYRIVLVSLTSEYDCLALYRAVSLLPSWQPGRSFVVVAGGAGLQNPIVIRRYVDYAVFGRAEEIIHPLLDCVLGGGEYEHESVMRLPDVHEVRIAQARALYGYGISLATRRGDREWREAFVGCPNKCLFCHYTWSRKRLGSGTYYQGSLTMGRSVEVLWRDIPKITAKVGRVRTAIDGFSERLRMAYGKRITNDEVVDGINHLGSFPGTTVMLVYNISNMPHETQADRDELYAVLRRANPKHRVIVVVQSTPFRPSLVTPMQWAPVTLYPATSDLSAQVIHDSDNLRVVHSFSNESPWSQLETVIVSRATEATDKLFHVLCHHPRLRAGTARARIRLLQRSFDLTDYLRGYSREACHPGWYLSSYTSGESLWKVYRRAERSMGEDL